MDRQTLTVLTTGMLFFWAPFLCASPYETSSDDNGRVLCTSDNFNDPDVCLNGVGAGVYGFDNTRLAASNFSTKTRSAAGDSTDNTAYLDTAHMSGMAAGAYFSGLSWWASYHSTRFDGNIAISNTGRVGDYDGDTDSILFGVDTLVTDQLIAGLAIGYENTEVFTLYNGGNNDSNGVTVVPYAAYLINKHFSIDAAFGYSFLEYDTDRVSTAAAATTITGEYDADRLFFSANLNANTLLNRFLLSARLGILYTEEEQDAYTETGTGARQVGERNIDLTQAIAGIEVAYAGDIFEPYLGLTYANDLDRDTGGSGLNPGLPGNNAPLFSDKDELQWALGARFHRDEITASLDYLDINGRSHFNSHSFMLNIRIDI